MIRRPPRSTRTDTLFPYTTLFRSITDQLKLRGGLRYTSDDKNFSAERLESPIGSPPTGLLTANPNDTDLSWDASLVWSASDNVNYFARVARGYRAPSIQGRLLFGDTLSVAKSESVVSYELGIKTEIPDTPR